MEERHVQKLASRTADYKSVLWRSGARAGVVFADGVQVHCAIALVRSAVRIVFTNRIGCPISLIVSSSWGRIGSSISSYGIPYSLTRPHGVSATSKHPNIILDYTFSHLNNHNPFSTTCRIEGYKSVANLSYAPRFNLYLRPDYLLPNGTCWYRREYFQGACVFIMRGRLIV